MCVNMNFTRTHIQCEIFIVKLIVTQLVRFLLWDLKVHCHVHRSMPVCFLCHTIEFDPSPMPIVTFSRILDFDGVRFSSPSIHKLEHYSMLAVCNCWSNVVVATLYIWKPSPSICNQKRMCHAMIT